MWRGQGNYGTFLEKKTERLRQESKQEVGRHGYCDEPDFLQNVEHDYHIPNLSMMLVRGINKLKPYHEEMLPALVCRLQSGQGRPESAVGDGTDKGREWF